MNDNRNYGLDIARIIAMCGIIILHILGQGGILKNIHMDNEKYWMAWWVEICAYCSVDLFALLSGWLGINKKKYSCFRMLELIITVIIYCIVVTLIFLVFDQGLLQQKSEIIKGIFPYLIGRYWYIICYIPLIALQTFINQMLMELSLKQHKILCLLSICIFTIVPTIMNQDYFGLKQGYSFGWLLICYVIGGYLKRREDMKSQDIGNKYLLIFLICSFLLLVSKLINYNFIEYTSPITLLMAIVLLLYMKNIKVNKGKKLIKMLSISAFDVYIIHCHILILDRIIFNHFIWMIKYSIIVLPFLIILSVVIIYVMLGIIGLFRIKVFKQIGVNKIINKISNKLDKIIYV